MRACRKVTSKLLPLPFATAIRAEASLPTAALGLITEPEHAEHIIATGEADAVFLARAMLRNPRWALMASEKLGYRIDWALPLDRGRTV
jgi:2,4-dienoyl-CoA reductase-like NADH-dependent reductase (Old Yellow Enzyme family)